MLHNKIIKPFSDMKLRTKLLVSYLFVVLLPLVTVGYFLIDKTTETFLNQTDYINKVNFQQVKKNISDQLKDYMEVSSMVEAEKPLIDYVNNTYDDNIEFFDKFVEYLRLSDTYTGVMRLKVNEKAKLAIYSTNDSIITDGAFIYKIDDEFIQNTQWCKRSINANGDIIIYGPYQNKNGQNVFSICRLLRQNAKYINIVKIEIYESEIYRFMSKEAAYKKVFLVNDENVIVSSTERELIGKNINTVSSIPNIEYNKYTDFSEIRDYETDNIVFIDNFNDIKALKNWKIVSVTSSESVLNDIRQIVINSIFICFIIFLVTVIFVLLFVSKLTKRLKHLVLNMSNIRDGRFDVFVDVSGSDEIAELSKNFKSMIDRINHLINEVYVAEMQVKDLKIEKQQAEIWALQSQINPHFLFNTMESIRMDLWLKKEYEISEVIERFSTLLRKSIEWSDESNTIGHEIQLIEDYLKIQKYRYVNKFDYIISVGQEFYDYTIPKFTLQPIVENAIYHGLELKNGKGCVTITAEFVGENIRIKVTDDGMGMKKEVLNALQNDLEGQDSVNGRKARIGIKNVHQRLKLNYGNKYGLKFESQEGFGTQVEVLLPGIKQC